MHLNVQEASVFVHKLNKGIAAHKNVETSVAPTDLCLQSLSLQVDHKKMSLTAQNLYWRDEGAYTGEVSAQQLRGLVKYALIGHSERRHIFGEREKDIRNKVQAAVRNHIVPVLCIGDTAIERSENETEAVLHGQIVSGLANLTAEEVRDVVIAYEPVWAIGTGDTATPSDIKKAESAIRRNIEHLFGAEVAKEVRLLYGGSVTPSTASGILKTKGVDGLLVGGASLHVNQFSEIIEVAHSLHDEKGNKA